MKTQVRKKAKLHTLRVFFVHVCYRIIARRRDRSHVYAITAVVFDCAVRYLLD